MESDELCYLSATEALARFRRGGLSPVELVDALIARAEAENPAINAFTHTFFERARSQAHDAERRYAADPRATRPLEGVPLVVKDGNAVAGEITTHGSMVYADHRPRESHPGVARLLDAGAILLARTTMPEFGEAGNCYSPLWGVTRNPWNPAFGPGGSSGGAGAALAAGMTTLADGSDIGGSIRIPAACCGVVGYKPPYGRNPNARAASFDPYQHYGPLTRCVADAALFQNVVSGFHVEDIGTLREVLELPNRFAPIAGWRVGYSVDLGYFQVDHAVRDNMMGVLDALRGLGCEVESIDVSWTEACYDAWQAVNATRGAAARMVKDLEKWRPHLADYTRDWLDHGGNVTPDMLVSALETHVEMYRALGPALERCRVFVCPTNAIPSVEADRSPLDLDISINGEPARPAIAEAWFMTYPFNMLSQLPVMSVPSGLAGNGVPTGVQLVGRSYRDLDVFQAAAALERVLEWDRRRPGLPGGSRRPAEPKSGTGAVRDAGPAGGRE